MAKHLRAITVLALVLACLPASAQTPADEALMRWERGINASRDDRLRALAPKVIPDCAFAASPAEMAAFFVYWRGMIQQERASRRADGRPEDDPMPASQLPFLRFIPSVPLAEMASVSQSTPGAADRARDEIEMWHLYSCVAQRFQASRYFGHYGFTGAPWPGGVYAKYGNEPDGRRAMMMPDMEILEPLDALGRFFRAAQASGALSFSSSREERYFFFRYESSYFVNVTRSDKTDAWFGAPPWAAHKPAP